MLNLTNASRLNSTRLEQNAVLVSVMAAFLLLLPALQAQVLYGSLTGHVTDSTGAVLPSAHVEAVNVNTGLVSQATTDASGGYRFVALLPGVYRVNISAPGFKTMSTAGVRVAANAVARVDTQMEVARANETVTVTAESQLLQTDRSDVHSDLNATQIQSLPAISSEGKSFQGLYRIIPGASLPGENNSAAGNPQRAMTANVNGQSNQGNNTRIDGVQDAYPWLPQNIAYVPPVNAIETVNVVTNSFDAEQGMAGGAAVNVQIKSGTNQFHGEVHEFHTDNALWARNYFNPSNFRKPLNVFNQFGASV